MSETKHYIRKCHKCGHQVPVESRFYMFGKCPVCGTWNTDHEPILTEAVTAQQVANTVLDVLRHFRDREPEAWDALMHTASAIVLMNMWDMLRSIAKAEPTPAKATRRRTKRPA